MDVGNCGLEPPEPGAFGIRRAPCGRGGPCGYIAAAAAPAATLGFVFEFGMRPEPDPGGNPRGC